MKKKRLLQFFIIILFFGGIFFFQTKSYFERKHFFKSRLNNKIIEINNNWSGGRSYDYVTNNKTVVTLINSDSFNLKLNDSIVKEGNSWEFDVFRTDEFELMYKFYKRYNLE